MGEAVEDRRRQAAATRLLTTGIGTAVTLSLLTPVASSQPVSGGGNCSAAGLFIQCEANDDGKPASGTSSSQGRAHARSGGKPPKCVVERMENQPPPGSMWYAGEGKIAYTRTCKTPSGRNGPTTGLALEEGQSPARVDPAVVAQQAIAKMKLAGPDIASPRAAGKYVVGVPMWLWVRQSPTTFGPNTATATAGGVTVTATAKVKKIVWRMGDGGTETCTGPGTPYKESYGMRESPTCGHRYTKTSAKASGGTFALTATSTWSVDWQVTGGGGEAGELTEIRQSQAQVAVGEVQVVG